jgi:predicted RND superfamily exporter protein
MNSIVRFVQLAVQRFPRAIVIAFVLVAAVAGFFASRVRIDSRISGLMIAGDAELERTAWLKRTFSNDEVLFLAFELEGPFAAEDLRRLARVSERVAEIAGVDEVIDLSNVEDVRGDGDMLDGSPLVDFAALGDDVSALHARARGHRLYRNLFVNDRLDVLGMVVIQSAPDDSKPNAPKQMVESVRRVLSDENLAWRVHRVGPPESEALADDLVRRDLATLGLPALLISLLVVFIATRRWRGVGLALLLVLWSEVILLGWFGASGTPLTMVTALAPVILLAPASIYAIYLLGLLQGLAAHEGIAELIERFAPSALLSATTTVAGFLALPSIGVRGVGDLGAALTVGIAAAALGSLFLLPVLIARLSLRIDHPTPVWLTRVGMSGIAIARRPWLVVTAAAVASLAAVSGLWHLEVETDPLDYFRPDHEHILSEQFVRREMSGTRVLNLVVDAGESDGAIDPSVLSFVDELTRHVARNPVVERTLSFLDYVYLMDAALEPGHPPRTVLPSRALLAQYLLLYESGGDPRDLRHFIDDDRARLNVMIRMSTVSTNEILALREQILAFAAARPDAPRVEVLGHAYLFAKASAGITSGMLRGLAIAIALVVLITALAMRSLPLALLAAVPTVAPIAVCGGALGWLGVPLSLGTSLVGSLALGLAVDDTAHVIAHVDRERGITHTYSVVAPALILESISLGLGFLVLAFSQFQTIAMLGFATSLTLVVALAFDLWVLPSLLVIAGYPVSGERA